MEAIIQEYRRTQVTKIKTLNQKIPEETQVPEDIQIQGKKLSTKAHSDTCLINNREKTAPKNNPH